MPSISSVIRGIVPPYLVRGYNLVKKVVNPPLSKKNLLDGVLFDGDDKLYKSILANCKVYGEYGCGKSTLWVARNTNADIYSVDTSLEWVHKVKDLLLPEINLERLIWIDLGEVGSWGTPISYIKRQNILDYVHSPWSHGDRKPDTVLIDGRFRVACFLSSLLHSEPRTQIIFDDYADRRKYHIAEEYCQVADRCGRQALFVVPSNIDKNAVESELNKFYYVMD